MAMFGAQTLIANMVGFIRARKLSGLMTAIILAGRSGSAFAAELGTMKIELKQNACDLVCPYCRSGPDFASGAVKIASRPTCAFAQTVGYPA